MAYRKPQPDSMRQRVLTYARSVRSLDAHDVVAVMPDITTTQARSTLKELCREGYLEVLVPGGRGGIRRNTRYGALAERKLPKPRRSAAPAPARIPNSVFDLANL